MVIGTPFDTVGNLTLYACERYTLEQTPTRTWASMNPLLDAVEIVPRASQNMIIHFENDDRTLTKELVFDAMAKKFQSSKVVMCVGALAEGGIIVYVRKSDNKAVPSLVINNHHPTIFKPKRGGNTVKTCEKTLHAMSESMTSCVMNMRIVRPQNADDLTFEQMVTAMSKYSACDLQVIKGTIELKEAKDRSPFEKAVLRVLPSIKAVRDYRIADYSDPMLISVSSPHVPIVPRKFVRGLWQVGHRLKEQTNNQYEQYRIIDLFENPHLLARYGVVLMGYQGVELGTKSAIHLLTAEPVC